MADWIYTERQWLDLPPREVPAGPRREQLVQFLRQVGSERRLRLFACACVRGVPDLPGDARLLRAVAAAEDFAEGRLNAADLERVRIGTYDVLAEYQFQNEIATHPTFGDDDPAVGLVAAVCELLHLDTAVSLPSWLREPFPYRATLYDVFGNPFRPVTVAAEWLAWRDGLVVEMARSIYDERRFVDGPILADALEEAGCAEPALLGHLRSPGRHVRGCWAIDLLLRWS